MAQEFVMQDGSHSGPVPPAAVWAGRAKEIAQLKRWHAQRRSVLLVGPAGVGKTALLQHLAQELPLVTCWQSGCLTDICQALENQLRLDHASRRLPERKQLLLRAVAQSGQAVVLDAVGWTSPKMSSFFESLCQQAPVWLATRSDHSRDIGHFWTWLVRFVRLELAAFRPAETRALVEAAVQQGRVCPETVELTDWLHRRSGGLPAVLTGLLNEIATGRYNLRRPHDLRLLDLDRRIHQGLAAPEP